MIFITVPLKAGSTLIDTLMPAQAPATPPLASIIVASVMLILLVGILGVWGYVVLNSRLEERRDFFLRSKLYQAGAALWEEEATAFLLAKGLAQNNGRAVFSPNRKGACVVCPTRKQKTTLNETTLAHLVALRQSVGQKHLQKYWQQRAFARQTLTTFVFPVLSAHRVLQAHSQFVAKPGRLGWKWLTRPRFSPS